MAHFAVFSTPERFCVGFDWVRFARMRHGAVRWPGRELGRHLEFSSAKKYSFALTKFVWFNPAAFTSLVRFVPPSSFFVAVSSLGAMSPPFLS